MDELCYHRAEAAVVSVPQVLNYLKHSPEASSLCSVTFEETADDDLVEKICRILLERPADLNVRSLYLRRNHLEQTDALSFLLESNETITSLDLSHNNLRESGINRLLTPLHYNNTTLTTLRLSHNNCQTADDVRILLQRSRTLKHLYMDNNPLGPKGIKLLAQEGFSSDNPSQLQTLVLSHTQLGNRGVRLLTEGLLHKSHNLTMLDVSGNSIDNKGAQKLSSLLMFDNRIERLDVSSNDFGPFGASMFSSCFGFNTRLRELMLGGNLLGPKGAGAIAESLRENTSLPLVKLDLSWNQIHNEGAVDLAQVVCSHPTLEYLNLAGNQIGTKGGVALAEALRYNGALETLTLTHNALCDRVAMALAETLIRNESLAMCETRDNDFTEEGTTRLSQAWRYRRNYREWLKSLLRQLDGSNGPTRIISLNLLSRKIGDDEVSRIASEMAKRRPCPLQSIFLGGDDISTFGISALASRFLALPTASRELQRLYVRSSHVGTAGVRELAQALPVSYLQELSLVKSGISDIDVVYLADALRRDGTQLLHLNLDYNRISCPGFRQLLEALREPHASLRLLSLAHNYIGEDDSDDSCFSLVGSTLLRELRLDHNRIRDDDALRLGRSIPSSSPMECLTLHGNRITRRVGIEISQWLQSSVDAIYL